MKKKILEDGHMNQLNNTDGVQIQIEKEKLMSLLNGMDMKNQHGNQWKSSRKMTLSH